VLEAEGTVTEADFGVLLGIGSGCGICWQDAPVVRQSMILVALKDEGSSSWCMHDLLALAPLYRARWIRISELSSAAIGRQIPS
jgi:hypothetical protein